MREHEISRSRRSVTADRSQTPCFIRTSDSPSSLKRVAGSVTPQHPTLRRAVGEKALDSSHLVDNSLIRSRSRSVKGLRVWITNASGGRVCISSSNAWVSQQGGKLTPQVIRDMLYCRQCGLGGHNFPPVSQGSLTHQDRTVRFSYRPLQREER